VSCGLRRTIGQSVSLVSKWMAFDFTSRAAGTGWAPWGTTSRHIALELARRNAGTVPSHSARSLHHPLLLTSLPQQRAAESDVRFSDLSHPHLQAYGVAWTLLLCGEVR
jgi:hypothetical protein